MAVNRSTGRRHRPLGTLRNLGRTLTPIARTAAKASLEREVDLRLRRLRAAAADRLEQRRRPSRGTMRALSLGRRGRLDWRCVPVPPRPGPEGAIVHPLAIATCDLDRPLMLGRTPFLLPLHLGHECVAEVVEVGAEVESVRPGDRVVVPFQINCGACEACRRGLTGSCLSVPPLSMYGFGVAGGHWGGALADLLAVPFADSMLLPLPAGVDPAAVAAAGDNITDAYRHVGPHLPAMLERDPGATVLIVASQSPHTAFGASVPLYAGQIALALGARRVLLVDARAEVRRRAAGLGLTAIRPGDLGDIDPCPLVIDTSASAVGLRRAISQTAPDGVCTSSGTLHDSIRIPTGLMFARNVELRIGRSHARQALPAVLDLVASGRIDPELVTTVAADLNDAPRTLSEHARGDAIKTVLRS
jgi:alcohol dehydrogenase